MRKGFSLIELLVVIAVFATLIALIFPVVQQIRENQKTVVESSDNKIKVTKFLDDTYRLVELEHDGKKRTFFHTYLGVNSMVEITSDTKAEKE